MASPINAYSEINFKKELKEGWSFFYSKAGKQQCNVASDIEAECERCWKLYQNATQGIFEDFLLGGKVLQNYDQSSLLIQNFGTLATRSLVDKSNIEDFLKAHPDPNPTEEKTKEAEEQKENKQQPRSHRDILQSHLTKGSILNETKWWIVANDIAMLGGIHSRKRFWISFENLGRDPYYPYRPENDELYSKSDKRITALGREIAMLKEAGYTPVWFESEPQKPGLVFLPPESGNIYQGRLLDITRRADATQIKDILPYLNAARSATTLKKLLLTAKKSADSSPRPSTPSSPSSAMSLSPAPSSPRTPASSSSTATSSSSSSSTTPWLNRSLPMFTAARPPIGHSYLNPIAPIPASGNQPNNNTRPASATNLNASSSIPPSGNQPNNNTRPASAPILSASSSSTPASGKFSWRKVEQHTK